MKINGIVVAILLTSGILMGILFYIGWNIPENTFLGKGFTAGERQQLQTMIADAWAIRNLEDQMGELQNRQDRLEQYVDSRLANQN